jgi:AbiV family abortive infection protein
MLASKNRSHQLTGELLQQYCNAALANAQELLDEAILLLQHEHHARAYFLAIASIEEVGKAVQAFDGMGRNLKDSAVAARLNVQFNDHRHKIMAAFVPWIIQQTLGSSDFSETLYAFLRIISDVQHGREPAMYTDIHMDGLHVQTPSDSVCPKNAEDSIRLAQNVLVRARPFVTQITPLVKTGVQDAFFALKPAVLLKMTDMQDFWEYYRSRMQAGDVALDTAAVQYHKDYLSKSLQFKSDDTSE